MRHRGHTLLEVFLAMILLTTVIFAVVGIYPGSMGSMTRSHQISVGSNVAQAAVEQIGSGPYNTVVVGVLPSVTQNDVQYNPSVTAVAAGAPGAPALADPNLTTFHVETIWNGTSNANYDYVLYNFCNPP